MKLRFTAELIDDNGELVSRRTEVETTVPKLEEYGERSRFYEVFDRYEKSALEARNQAAVEITQSYLNAAAVLKKGAKDGRKREIEAEIGRISVENADAITPALQPKERIYTLNFMELELMSGSAMSYRKGLDLLNRTLRRTAENEIKFRTYLDFCQRAGKKAEEHAAREAEEHLIEHGFDAESGKVRSEEELPLELCQSAKPKENTDEIRKAIESINATRKAADEQVRESQTETEDPENTVYISADDVGVRHQKEHRTEDNQKDGAFVWSTNAIVQSSQGEKAFTCVGMRKLFCFVLGYLLNQDLLEKHSLVFFIDGASNLTAKIAEMFAFHPYRIILDWYHLRKRCQEYLSMSFRSREDKEQVLQKLLRILWAGNVSEAIAYLRSLDQNLLRPKNRICDLTGYLEKHREHIPCYALRAKLGLKNSSNRVEKENDLIVAQRQKHNGMSWSTTGSGALAQIAVLSINGELRDWLRDDFLSSIPA